VIIKLDQGSAGTQPIERHRLEIQPHGPFCLELTACALSVSFGERADREFHRKVAQSTPLRRWGRPQDVAHAALYLASPEAVFVTGQAINVNGGHLAPVVL
jgi:NAD(P)-dependent dehydrogenase (short-subunit alcohol dehydrogenase family)